MPDPYICSLIDAELFAMKVYFSIEMALSYAFEDYIFTCFVFGFFSLTDAVWTPTGL